MACIVNDNRQLSSEASGPVAIAILDRRIISQHRQDVAFYIISQPLSTATSILTLASLHVKSTKPNTTGAPLYTLEDLGEKNSLFIRSQSSSPASYPGFGELKYSRHLSGKRWELRYEDGKKRVFSRKPANDQAEKKCWARWFGESGTVLATETEQGIELAKELNIGNQMTGLLIAAWLATRWHAETAEERASIDAISGRSHSTSSKRRDWNRFFGNLAAGI